MVQTYPTTQGFFSLGTPLWGGVPDQSCMDARPNDYWRCYMGEYAIPYITTPLLVHQESEDFVQLLFNGVAEPFNTTQKEDYLNYFREKYNNCVIQSTISSWSI